MLVFVYSILRRGTMPFRCREMEGRNRRAGSEHEVGHCKKLSPHKEVGPDVRRSGPPARREASIRLQAIAGKGGTKKISGPVDHQFAHFRESKVARTNIDRTVWADRDMKC